MLKNIFKILVIFIVGMVGGIFANQFFWSHFVEGPGPVYLTETKQIIIRENVALVDAVERVKRTVVGVRTQTQAGRVLQGSGFIVTSDGLMVTLAELVPQGSNFSFLVDNNSVSFQILKRDLKENLALIKISDSVLTTASFARLEKLKMGERVFLVGTSSINEGIVKSFDENFIQTNILESALLAGSPLFNIEGEVLGINTIDSEGRVITIPISRIREFIGI